MICSSAARMRWLRLGHGDERFRAGLGAAHGQIVAPGRRCNQVHIGAADGLHRGAHGHNQAGADDQRQHHQDGAHLAPPKVLEDVFENHDLP